MKVLENIFGKEMQTYFISIKTTGIIIQIIDLFYNIRKYCKLKVARNGKKDSNRICYGGGINMPVTAKELEKIRREGLKALKEKLGVEDMIKFIQMYSDGKGDYTKEREEILKEITIEDFEGFLDEQ